MSWNSFWSGVGAAVTQTTAAVSDVVDDVVDAVGEALSDAVDEAEAAGKAAVGAVSDPFGSTRAIVDFGVTTGEKGIEYGAQAGSAFVGSLGAYAGRMVDNSEAVVDSAGNVLDDIAKAASDPFGTAKGAVDHGVATGEKAVDAGAQAGRGGVAFVGGVAGKAIDGAEQLAGQTGEAFDEASEFVGHLSGRVVGAAESITQSPGVLADALITGSGRTAAELLDEGAEWYGWVKGTAVNTFQEGVGFGRAGTEARFGDEAAERLNDAIRLGGFDPEDFPGPDRFEGVDDATAVAGQLADEVSAAAVGAATEPVGGGAPILATGGARTPPVVQLRAEQAQLRADRLDRLRRERDSVDRAEDASGEPRHGAGESDPAGSVGARGDDEASEVSANLDERLADLRERHQGLARQARGDLDGAREGHRRFVDEQLEKARDSYSGSVADPRAAALRDLADHVMPERQARLERVREMRDNEAERSDVGGGEIAELAALVSGQATAHGALLAVSAARADVARETATRGSPEDGRTNVAEVLVESAATEAAVAEATAGEAAFLAEEAAVARLAAAEAEAAGDVATAVVNYRAADGLAFARDRCLVTVGAARRSAQETAAVTLHVADERPELMPAESVGAITSVTARVDSTAEQVERHAAELALDDLESRIGISEAETEPHDGEDVTIEPTWGDGAYGGGVPEASPMAEPLVALDDDFGAGSRDVVGVIRAEANSTSAIGIPDRPPLEPALDGTPQADELSSMPSDPPMYREDEVEELDEPELVSDE